MIPSRRTSLLFLALLAAPLHALAAQDGGTVEILARLLAAEDARRFDQPLLQQALADPDSSVRAIAATSAGRLGDPRAVRMVGAALSDPVPGVQLAAAFGLGLLRDSTAATYLRQRAQDGTPVPGPLALEMITAAARSGGPEGAGFVRSVLEGSLWGDRDDFPYLVARAALESWRLGRRASVDALLPVFMGGSEDGRFSAAFSLVRLRAAAAVPRFLDVVGSRAAAGTRALAARGLARVMVDSAGLEHAPVEDLLLRATRDEDAGVRIAALRSLASYQDPAASAKVLPLLGDPLQNVQVQAAEALGALGGPEAGTALAGVVTGGKGSWALRRQALLSLAQADSAGFRAAAAGWAGSSDWRERAVAGEAMAAAAPGALGPFLSDADPRVVAATLGAWGRGGTAADTAYIAACRRLIQARDAVVRSAAADALALAADPADRPALLDAYRAGARDSIPDARWSVLGALQAGLAHEGTGERELLAALGPAPDYQVRQWAEQHWPGASDVLGPAYPVQTGRTMQDYRQVVREFLVLAGQDRYPKVQVQLEAGGSFTLELFGPEAPLTVLNFLRLVDRRYFDGMRFHRVVPDFVVQTGDPRGDGWGGPGGAIRDEINPRRYKAWTVGMALSGADTGGSQWFITLSPQPGLDGGYTVFGQVTDGIPAVQRITQGDRIRTIRR